MSDSQALKQFRALLPETASDGEPHAQPLVRSLYGGTETGSFKPCGHKEYDESVVDPADENNEYEGHSSEKKCVAAWKVWFEDAIKQLTDAGELPKWLKDM